MAAEAGSNSPEMQFVRAVMTLHDKFNEYVDNCFGGSTLFHKARDQGQGEGKPREGSRGREKGSQGKAAGAGADAIAAAAADCRPAGRFSSPRPELRRAPLFLGRSPAALDETSRRRSRRRSTCSATRSWFPRASRATTRARRRLPSSSRRSVMRCSRRGRRRSSRRSRPRSSWTRQGSQEQLHRPHCLLPTASHAAPASAAPRTPCPLKV